MIGSLSFLHIIVLGSRNFYISQVYYAYDTCIGKGSYCTVLHQRKIIILVRLRCTGFVMRNLDPQ